MIAGGNHISDQLAEKVGQQEQVLYYQWPAFHAQEQDNAFKVVETAASVVETESSVVAVFPGSGTEDDRSKDVEAAASVVAVSNVNFWHKC